jgi:hypothetical protein
LASANAPPLFVPSLVAKLPMVFSLDIPLLPLDFLFPQRVMVARPVEVDNIALARILENRSIRTKGILLDCRKLQITKRSR